MSLIAEIAEIAGYLGTLVCRASEHRPMISRYLLQPATMLAIKGAVRCYEKYGESGWDSFYRPAFTAMGKIRSGYLQRKLGMKRGDVASLASYHDYEDPLLGVEGYWEKQNENEAIRVETECPYGEYLKTKKCPQVCQNLIGCMETATAKSVDERYELEPLKELISNGDSRCVFIHRLKS